MYLDKTIHLPAQVAADLDDRLDTLGAWIAGLPASVAWAAVESVGLWCSVQLDAIEHPSDDEQLSMWMDEQAGERPDLPAGWRVLDGGRCDDDELAGMPTLAGLIALGFPMHLATVILAGDDLAGDDLGGDAA